MHVTPICEIGRNFQRLFKALKNVVSHWKALVLPKVFIAFLAMCGKMCYAENAYGLLILKWFYSPYFSVRKTVTVDYLMFILTQLIFILFGDFFLVSANLELILLLVFGYGTFAVGYNESIGDLR